MADSDIVEILQSQRENKTRANTAIKKLSRAKVKQKKILRFNRAIAVSEECEPAAKRIRTDEPVGEADMTFEESVPIMVEQIVQMAIIDEPIDVKDTPCFADVSAASSLVKKAKHSKYMAQQRAKESKETRKSRLDKDKTRKDATNVL